MLARLAFRIVKLTIITQICLHSIAVGATESRSSLCMSDNELRYFLAEMFMYSMGKQVGSCIARHPSIRDKLIADLARWMKSVEFLSERSPAIAKMPFERVFPGQGRTYLNKQVDWAADLGISKMQFSYSECQSIASAVEGFGDLGEGAVWGFVDSFYSLERSQIPRC